MNTILQAITTKFLGATDTLGERISASCKGGRIVMPYLHGQTTEQSHRRVAEDLMVKMEWFGKYDIIGGGRGDDRVWVQVPREIKEAMRHASMSYHHPACEFPKGHPKKCTCHVAKAENALKSM